MPKNNRNKEVIDKMEEDVNSVKILNLEKSVKELKEDTKINSNNAENRVHFEQIFDSLKTISINITKVTESLDSNSKATTATENVVDNLKLTTDKLTSDVKEANKQIGLIQEAPLKSYLALKNAVYGCVISALVGGLVVHFLGSFL